jgi:molybdenum cofactor biosynthesis enzyme MoaA
MAIRLSTDNKLQLCLLNQEKNIDLNGLSEREIEESFLSALRFYEEAYFVQNTSKEDKI